MYRLLVLPILLVTFGLYFLAVRRGANRFARRQRERGLWDEHGPKHPTNGPPDKAGYARSWWRGIPPG